jgi:hypothetical protein
MGSIDLIPQSQVKMVRCHWYVLYWPMVVKGSVSGCCSEGNSPKGEELADPSLSGSNINYPYIETNSQSPTIAFEGSL